MSDLDRARADAALVALSEWIDAGNSHRDPEAVMWGRVSKVGEEFGEVIEAVIGWTGQNPRKGKTHSKDDVIEELLDVAVTALGAIEHLREHPGDSLDLLNQKIMRVADRAGVFPKRAGDLPAEAERLREEIDQCWVPLYHNLNNELDDATECIKRLRMEVSHFSSVANNEKCRADLLADQLKSLNQTTKE